MKQFTFIDLFAGVGGFHFAMKKWGGECVFASEIDANARKTYFENHGIEPFGNITQDEIKSHIPNQFDILCGGFPCQAFSLAGKQKGFLDSRGTLFFEIEKIVEKHRPKVVFLENVKNLVSHDKGNTFKTILDILQNKLNYTVFYKVMNTCEYANIPQNRERVFIVAFDNERYSNIHFEFPDKIPLTKGIRDIIESDKKEDKYYYTDKFIHYEKLVKGMTDFNTIYMWSYGKVKSNKKNLCPTLMAAMGGGGHLVPLILDEHGIRKLTPNECFKFQGYQNFKMPNIANSHLYKQAGNSITVVVVERIAEKIVEFINNN